MSSTTKLVLAAVIAGVVGVALGAGVVYYNQNAKIAALEAQMAASKAQLENSDQALAESIAKVEELNAQLASATVEATEAAPVAPKPSSAPIKQFTFIKDITNTSGKTTISADYAQMLTGDAAAKAAKANGDESPPPNDYYIVNANKKVRVLPVKAGIQVTLTSKDDGTVDTNGYKVSLGQYQDWMSGMGGRDFENILKAVPYYITIKNGVVIAIEEVFLP